MIPWKCKKKQTSFLREIVENADLHKTALNKIMTTQEESIKYDFVAPLKSSKCVRPNSMPTKILHLIVDKISIPLSEIIIKSFSTCSFRNICKTAKAIPIFKTESKLLCNNYRPISLLSNISKIIGKIMH